MLETFLSSDGFSHIKTAGNALHSLAEGAVITPEQTFASYIAITALLGLCVVLPFSGTILRKIGKLSREKMNAARQRKPIKK